VTPATCAAAGHVDADPIERSDVLAEARAVLVRHPPRLRHRRGVIALDALGRVVERRPRRGIERGGGGGERRPRDLEVARPARVEAIEALRVLEQRRVPARAHRVENLADGGAHRGRDL